MFGRHYGYYNPEEPLKEKVNGSLESKTLYPSHKNKEDVVQRHQHGDLIAIGYPSCYCLYRLTITTNRKNHEEVRTLNWLYSKVGK